MSDRDDFITKIIQKEIRDRKSKSETRDIISTSRNSEDDGYTRLLNKMASKIKKKKKKKSKTVQVENENASIPAEYDIVKLNTVMTSVDTIVPKKAKKRKRQTSCNVDGNDLKIDLMMSKIKKAKMNKITAAEDDLPQTYFLDKQDKKKKKKKKKSHDLSVDEIINDYEMKSKTSDCNTTTINTVESSEDINENTLLSEKLDKKRKKKKKKSRDLRIDEIINDFKMMSKVPDSNKTTINTVESSDDINEITFSLEKQDKKRKKKKKKSCNLSINEIINNYKMMSKVPENIKTTINTVESSDVINEKALGIEKQEKKKKKKSRDLSIDEIINDYKMKSKISDSNTISINSVKSSDDINENKLLLHTSKKKKKKKAEKVQSNNGNPFIQNKDELNYIEETNISVPKKLKKKNRQKSCDISYNDLEADCIMTQNIPKIIQVPSNLINSSTSSEDSDDNMKSPILPKTQKKKKKEMSSKAELIEVKTIPLVEKDTLERIRWKTARERRLGYDTIEETRNTRTSRSGSSIFGCGMCEMPFGCHSDRSKHMTMTHVFTEENRPFKCDVCGGIFRRKYHLGRYYRTHTGEKLYACNVCGKAFTTSSELKKHYRTHTGEKPYECGLCDKSFSDNSNRNKYILTHVRRL